MRFSRKGMGEKNKDGNGEEHLKKEGGLPPMTRSTVADGMDLAYGHLACA